MDQQAAVGTLHRIIGQQRRMRIAFVEVFHDHRRLVQRQVAIDQGRYAAVGVALRQHRRTAARLDIDHLYRHVLLGQDQADAMAVMIGRVGIAGQLVD